MNFKQSFTLALKSLRTSKMRAFLTMLGIIIGVASVIVFVSLMNGLSSDMTSQFESMGTNTITVNLTGRGGNRAAKLSDIEELVTENPTLLEYYSPLVTASVTVKSGTESVRSTVKGVNEYYSDMQHIELKEGRFVQYIGADRRQKVCVIGGYIAQELFGDSAPLGETIKINGSNYKIVGILETTAEDAESSEDDVIYVPYSSATRRSFNGQINTYYITAADTENIDITVALIKNTLYQIYGSDSAYQVTSMTAMIEQVAEMTGSMSAVLVGIARISLVVGGIGIMNIMLVSVTERTREIGILFGILVSVAAGKIMGMTVIVSLNAVILAFSVSVGIGIIFGYFPASKAAKIHPIDALRYD